MKKGLILALLAVSATSFAESSFETKVGVGKTHKSGKTDIVSTTNFKIDLPHDAKAEVAVSFGNHNTIFKKKSGIKLSKKFDKYGTLYAVGRLDSAVRLGYKNDFMPVEGLTVTGGIEAQRIYKNKEYILSETGNISNKKSALMDRYSALLVDPDDPLRPNLLDDIDRMDARLHDIWDQNGSLAEALATKSVKPYAEAKYKQDNYEVSGKFSYNYSHDHIRTRAKEFDIKDPLNEIGYKVITRTPEIELKGQYNFKDYNTKVGAELVLDQFNLRTRANNDPSEVLRDNTITLKNWAEYEYKKDKWTVTPRLEILNKRTKTKSDTNEKGLLRIAIGNKYKQFFPAVVRVHTENKSKTFGIKPSLKVNYEIEKGFDVYSVVSVNREYNTKTGIQNGKDLDRVKTHGTDTNITVGMKYTW